MTVEGFGLSTDLPIGVSVWFIKMFGRGFSALLADLLVRLKGTLGVEVLATRRLLLDGALEGPAIGRRLFAVCGVDVWMPLRQFKNVWSSSESPELMLRSGI
jgi:hypothetical protein